MTEHRDRLSSWTGFFSALAGLLGKIAWLAVVIVIITALGRYLYQAGAFRNGAPTTEYRSTPSAPMPTPVPWDKVDRALADAFSKSRLAAHTYASTELDRWEAELMARVDQDFLPWYFSYLQQQWLGLKAIGYWTAEKVLDEQPTVAERITQDIQEEFSKRVLRPRIAQLRIERVLNGTMAVYIQSLQREVEGIPERYSIPQTDWDRYLADVAVLSSSSEGNRRIALSLKALVAASAAGGAAGSVQLLKGIQAMVAKIGTKVSAKGAGKAAAMAAKTGSKVGAKVGGKFLGPIIGVGILVWDFWDHFQTRRIEEPILRENLADYLDEVKRSLLEDPETGIMTLIDSIQTTMISSLPASNTH